MEKGKLVYEYNMMIIEPYTVASKQPLVAGKHKIEMTTVIEGNKPGAGGNRSWRPFTFDGKINSADVN